MNNTWHKRPWSAIQLVDVRSNSISWSQAFNKVFRLKMQSDAVSQFATKNSVRQTKKGLRPTVDWKFFALVKKRIKLCICWHKDDWKSNCSITTNMALKTIWKPYSEKGVTLIVWQAEVGPSEFNHKSISHKLC